MSHQSAATVAPAVDRAAAVEYLKSHNVAHLLESWTKELIDTRPEDPTKTLFHLARDEQLKNLRRRDGKAVDDDDDDDLPLNLQASNRDDSSARRSVDGGLSRTASKYSASGSPKDPFMTADFNTTSTTW